MDIASLINPSAARINHRLDTAYPIASNRNSSNEIIVIEPNSRINDIELGDRRDRVTNDNETAQATPPRYDHLDNYVREIPEYKVRDRRVMESDGEYSRVESDTGCARDSLCSSDDDINTQIKNAHKKIMKLASKFNVSINMDAASNNGYREESRPNQESDYYDDHVYEEVREQDNYNNNRYTRRNSYETDSYFDESYTSSESNQREADVYSERGSRSSDSDMESCDRYKYKDSRNRTSARNERSNRSVDNIRSKRNSSRSTSSDKRNDNYETDDYITASELEFDLHNSFDRMKIAK